MTGQQRYILELIHSAVEGQDRQLPSEVDLGKIMPIVRRHRLENLAYYGAVNCGIDTKLPVMQRLFTQTCKYVMTDHLQMHGIQRLLETFATNGIRHMPLKGILRKALYPRNDMRLMGDGDILIKMDQYDRIKTVMEQLGYEFRGETDHELIWQSPHLRLELHKRLIPSYNYDYAAYYGDGWQLGHPTADNPCRFVMTDEDQMVYLFTHFAKHYRDGGIGIRHMLDLYLYRKAKPQMNHGYIAQQLQKLQLFEFYQNILHTLAVWFDAEASDNVADLITDTVFGSGCFGTYTSRTVAQGIRNKAKYKDSTKRAKLKTVGRLIFLPYEIMCEKYPVLHTAPVLLPIMWVVRWLDALLCKPKVIGKHCQRVKLLSERELNSWETQLNEVGLAFHFEEKKS